MDDTPFEAFPNYICQTSRDTCPAPGEDPITNYMDYSRDACSDTFTDGQRVRMGSLTTQHRPLLGTSPYLESVSDAVQERWVLGDSALRSQGFTVPAGTSLFVEPGVSVAFEPGAAANVQGHARIDGAAFSASSSTEGWSGVKFFSGSSGVLRSSEIQDVQFAACGTGFCPEQAAVTVYDATMTIEGAVIGATRTGSGVIALGPNANVEVKGESLISDNEHYGMKAHSGALIRIWGSSRMRRTL